MFLAVAAVDEQAHFSSIDLSIYDFLVGLVVHRCARPTLCALYFLTSGIEPKQYFIQFLSAVYE